MSNTKNDEIEVEGETYVKWNTKNDWVKEFDKRFEEWNHLHYSPNKTIGLYEFIIKELSDARRELIDEIDMLLAMTESTTEDTTHEEMLRIVGNIRKDLATLRKEGA